MVNIQVLFDDDKYDQTIREMRWPDGVTCPYRSSASVIKNGRDDTEPHRQRYQCQGCQRRFDDLTGTIFAGHHQALRTWIACLDLIDRNLFGLQIAQKLEINKYDAKAMIQRIRQGIVEHRPPRPAERLACELVARCRIALPCVIPSNSKASAARGLLELLRIRPDDDLDPIGRRLAALLPGRQLPALDVQCPGDPAEGRLGDMQGVAGVGDRPQ